MAKIELSKPTLFILYGFPGSGKSYLAKNLKETIKAAHINSDRIRHQLFEQPRYDNPENEIVNQLMEYMTEEFLEAGVSVIFDINAQKKSQRRLLRDIARKSKAEYVLIWLQIDPETSFSRVSNRDRRKTEDKYAQPMDKPLFNEVASKMQQPGRDEDFIVLSGKHSFPMQKSSIIRRLYDIKLIDPNNVSSNVVKPGLVNLVPGNGRVDMSRRNIRIR